MTNKGPLYAKGYDDGFSDGANDERAKAQTLADAVKALLGADGVDIWGDGDAAFLALKAAFETWERDDD